MKKKLRKKQINIFSINIGSAKWMRNHPLYGESYKREENIKEFFRRPKERKFR